MLSGCICIGSDVNVNKYLQKAEEIPGKVERPKGNSQKLNIYGAKFLPHYDCGAID